MQEGKTAKKGIFARFSSDFHGLRLLICHSPMVFNTISFTCLLEEELLGVLLGKTVHLILLHLLHRSV